MNSAVAPFDRATFATDAALLCASESGDALPALRRLAAQVPPHCSDEAANVLRPFILIAERHAALEQEARQAREEAERRIREVATVYEVGQAMDRVEIDRLLDMVTERAAFVMDAQACSLLLRQQDSLSFVIVASHGLPDDVVENTRIFLGEGIAGQVAQSGEPLLLNSLDGDPRFRDRERDGVASSICMPLRDENGRVQGVLCIRRRAGAPVFTPEDLRLFSIFATQASLAVNNAQLYAQLNHKLQELSTLAALSETVSSTLDLDQVLNQVADNIVDVVHFDRCRIYLSDPDTDEFAPRIVRGFSWDADGPNDPACRAGEGVIGMVAQRQMPLLVKDVADALPMLRDYGAGLGMTAFYAQPIVARGVCIGVVVVSNTGAQTSITSSSIELLTTFVHQAGIAIENARFYAGQERRYAELVTLYDASRTLAATSGVQSAAETVSDLAVKITDSDAGLLLLFDDTRESLSVLHARGVSESLSQRLRLFSAPVPAGPEAKNVRAPRLFAPSDTDTPLGPEWVSLCREFRSRHRATALVPLTVDDAPVGFLLLGKKSGEYSAGALKLLSVASSQAASVLVNARSYERRIGQRELELSAIRELMQTLRAATTLDDALNSILDIVASLVWSDRSSLLTLDADGQTLTERAGRGERPAEGPVPRSLSDDSIAARALRERTALIDTQGGKRRQPKDQSKEMQSGLALPLIVGDELLGVLTMQSRAPGLYNEESVKMLHLVASQAATIYREMSSLRNLTRYTDNILRSIAAGVVTVDKTGAIVTWNRRAEEITGLRAAEIVGTHYTRFLQMLEVDGGVREETLRMLEMTAQTGHVFTRNQFCYHTPERKEKYVNLSASQLKSEEGEYLGVVIVFEDVTGEVSMKEEVERVSKLAETGQLAANIAHELRNPLSSIKGAAQLLRKELPADYVHGEFLDIIVEEVNGLNRMTTEFLEFSRVTPPQMRETNVNTMVSRLVTFMGAYLSARDVVVLQALDDDVPALALDKSQIEQVVKNIVINAAQAMPHGGYLTVSSRFFASSDTVEMAFTDTGVGIPPEKMEQIWTPFFTTKTKGTGLGLAIARKIVETHGGKLSVRTTPGEGSTFTMHLPVSPQEVALVSHKRTEITEQRTGRAGGVEEARVLYDSEP